MRTSAAAVANKLEAEGFEPFDVAEPDYDMDGTVYVSPTVHVQVGFTYVNVVQECDGGESFRFFEAASNYADLIRDLREALKGE